MSNNYIKFVCNQHSYMNDVRTLNKFNRPVLLLGSQYIYNVGFEFPTLGDFNLETQQYFYNLWTPFLSLFVFY